MASTAIITGEMLIGARAVRGHAGELQAIAAATGKPLGPVFGGGGEDEVDRACELAAAAFPVYRDTAPESRAAFLEAIADGVMALGDVLIERAHQETALPVARLAGSGRARSASCASSPMSCARGCGATPR